MLLHHLFKIKDFRTMIKSHQLKPSNTYKDDKRDISHHVFIVL